MPATTPPGRQESGGPEGVLRAPRRKSPRLLRSDPSPPGTRRHRPVEQGCLVRPLQLRRSLDGLPDRAAPPAPDARLRRRGPRSPADDLDDVVLDLCCDSSRSPLRGAEGPEEARETRHRGSRGVVRAARGGAREPVAGRDDVAAEGVHAAPFDQGAARVAEDGGAFAFGAVASSGHAPGPPGVLRGVGARRVLQSDAQVGVGVGDGLDVAGPERHREAPGPPGAHGRDVVDAARGEASMARLARRRGPPGDGPGLWPEKPLRHAAPRLPHAVPAGEHPGGRRLGERRERPRTKVRLSVQLRSLLQEAHSRGRLRRLPRFRPPLPPGGLGSPEGAAPLRRLSRAQTG
mmetsp:Transcript_13718/g.44747  ORF Transcript_13718/g.44747 Transcript_13718/m.44747 type:complete len:347 (-) Transcript_13718:1029-2069(-)